MSQPAKKVYVLTRRLELKSGSCVDIVIGAFRDKGDADREAATASDRLAGLPPPVMQVLQFIGIKGIGFVVVETTMTEGAGLVLVGPDALPPPRLA